MGCKDDPGPQGPDSKPGPPGLEDSLRENLEHGMENFFRKKIGFKGKWKMHLISLYAFANLKSLTVDFTGSISIPKWW